MFSARAFPTYWVFSATFAAASLVLVPALAARARNTTASVKRQAAQLQFAKAEEQRAVLNSKPVPERTLADYKQVVNAYRRVTLIGPRAPEVPDSLMAIAELNTEMGDRFGRSYFQAAADTYQFLVHQYPASKHCPEALLSVAHLQRDQLSDPALASKTYEEFLKLYPRSPRRRQAQEALAELALLQRETASASDSSSGDAAAPVRNSASARDAALPPARAASNLAPGEMPRVRRISTSATPDSTRVTIDLEGRAAYSSARIKKPDRIYFDIRAARVTPDLARREIRVDSQFVKSVRVAQYQAGVVRIAFDVTGVKGYTASLIGEPPSLVIDFYGTAAALRAAKSSNAPTRAAEAQADPPSPTAKKLSIDVADSAARPGASSSSPPTAAVRDTLPVATGANSRSRNRRTASANGAPASPPSPPQPTRDGQATLTRTLGLKIGRIVIDPGHGGHDTGTIGPTGLMEKDLCLDVALRLGRIIDERLPGAEVVYTRSDDTFIPLELRTGIANEKKADLFLSIHANSSRDHAARGVETYYLNLKGSPEAMEVAARENASAQETVADLQDLVKKIARNEKIEESREFAEDIQDSLTRRIQRTNRTIKNRGVRRAPFVVLIGANMPSVLAEIAFLSNSSDEQLLKKAEYRQRLAEGLFQGVVSYLQSLNSVTYNLPARNLAGRASIGSTAGASAPVEQSRNQQ